MPTQNELTIQCKFLMPTGLCDLCHFGLNSGSYFIKNTLVLRLLWRGGIDCERVSGGYDECILIPPL